MDEYILDDLELRPSLREYGHDRGDVRVWIEGVRNTRGLV